MNYSILAAQLRKELEEMANRASVDFELWGRFSNRVLTGADAIEVQAKQISTIRNQAMKACEWRDDAILKKDARIAELEAALKNCADDLEAELRARYGFVGGGPIHPAENKRFQRDMATVIAARAALGQNNSNDMTKLEADNREKDARIAELEKEIKARNSEIVLIRQIARDHAKFSDEIGARLIRLEMCLNRIEAHAYELVRAHSRLAGASGGSWSGKKQKIRANEASKILGFIRKEKDKLQLETEEEINRSKTLREAGETVVKWWVSYGQKRIGGAPYAIFKLRKALGHVSAALGEPDGNN